MSVFGKTRIDATSSQHSDESDYRKPYVIARGRLTYSSLEREQVVSAKDTFRPSQGYLIHRVFTQILVAGETDVGVFVWKQEKLKHAVAAYLE